MFPQHTFVILLWGILMSTLSNKTYNSQPLLHLELGNGESACIREATVSEGYIEHDYQEFILCQDALTFCVLEQSLLRLILGDVNIFH